MALHSRKNQYRGINAHLHSYWQAAGGWSRFHTNHITDLMRTLRPLLLPLGYTADVEPSIQIRRIDDPGTVQFPESDVTIYDLNPLRAATPRPLSSGTAELVLSIPDALFGQPLSDREYSAVAIYPQRAGQPRGEPVVWIELLSPSNKPGGRDAQTYFDKRLMILQSGITFVELDYLHESRSTLRGIPAYDWLHHEDTHAYRITVIDPTPDWEQGAARIRAFDVDAPIPEMSIPLSDSDQLVFDFGLPYTKTYEETLYGLQLVDYSQLPAHFDRYHQADQTRIARRMTAVIDAAQSGLDLEAGPFPTGDLPLETALQQIAAFQENKR